MKRTYTVTVEGERHSFRALTEARKYMQQVRNRYRTPYRRYLAYKYLSKIRANEIITATETNTGCLPVAALFEGNKYQIMTIRAEGYGIYLVGTRFQDEESGQVERFTNLESAKQQVRHIAQFLGGYYYDEYAELTPLAGIRAAHVKDAGADGVDVGELITYDEPFAFSEFVYIAYHEYETL